jgi:hypothetical protein
MLGMGGSALLLSPEVRAWLAALGDDDFGRVAFYLDLLRERHGRLAGPHSHPLRGRLHRLEIPGRRRPHRLTYYAAGNGTIVLLTVWHGWRGARLERARALTVLRRRSGSERSCDESP